MKKFTTLLLIIVLGFLLRIYKLDVRPLGFTWDEAALGYNAYSLLKTGRDEHAQRFPVVFKSFGDYKPGLYIYFTVPSVKLLSLNEFSTRLPSAIFGTLLILVVYLLTCKIENLLKIENCKLNISLASAAMLAVNPWAIHFSRGAWEANAALLLTTLATLLFLKRKYYFAALFFGLTFLTYQGAKLFTPLLIISLVLIYKPVIKNLFKPLLLLLLLLLPILAGFATQSGRLKVYSVFSYTRSTSQVAQVVLQDKDNKTIFFLFHSEILDQTRGVIERYLNHLSPRFLFIDGDWSNPRNSTPFYGYLHYPEILTMLIGLVVLIKSNNKFSKLLLMWLVLAPVPSALSRDIVSGVRSLPMVIPLVIISGIGLGQIFKTKFVAVCYSLLLLLFTVYFLDLYFVHYPFYFAKYWLTPYKNTIELINNNIDSYKRVVFTNTLGQPYIFVLFYNHIDPRLFWTSSNYIANSVGDVGEVVKFGKYVFMPVDWPAQRGDTSTIFVGNQYELPDQDMNSINLVRLGEVFHPDGSHGLRLIGLK
ncbi:hypothetical protein A2634_04910 [Candidatus Amesbacteria bacterium RIFCSPHIGHO2_01_FULL_48_32]|uniref:Uncharacterized protein n=1 Tax=Candidatus Amesbacteria bacterium RIFCSPLOWO2_01_FULL_48_25 TaxID=1797259 RepID=A0A1F4ZCV7_9BACT|nr:MAG: hypothetical protein A2634_04910 [Candidatus Amesbacteria bacterium RIFCSPHIGHO2_01_FULL_48_32]OGD04008.1 MAG: hypothetical protein A2989_01260 [Candidatus Amesbacteria bacterium RIFCSPLOWO2_01_FULL_48_25]HJZ05728.1 hypothetical protein [Patescibacteria group bacterium]